MNNIYLNSKLTSRRLIQPNTLSGKTSREYGGVTRKKNTQLQISGEYRSNSKLLMQISYLNSDIDTNLMKIQVQNGNSIMPAGTSNSKPKPSESTSRPDSNLTKINLKLSNSKRVTASKANLNKAESKLSLDKKPYKDHSTSK